MANTHEHDSHEEPRTAEGGDGEAVPDPATGGDDPRPADPAAAADDPSAAPEAGGAGELLARLNAAEEKAQEQEQKHLRAVADLENFRRRAARDREEIRDSALTGLIEDLLPVLDTLELGLQAADDHPEAAEIANGFRMVAVQLQRTLESFGLAEERPTGRAFDPNLHDCVSQRADNDHAEGIVVETVRPGYRLRERLVRAATVIVSSGPGAAGESAEEGSSAPENR
jgi:molecular chaperone GrpE